MAQAALSGTFLGAAASLQGRTSRQSASRRLAVSVRADKALIVNTKGGGHAFLGLHLAKKLLSAGHSVTILNDGDKVSTAFAACAAAALPPPPLLPPLQWPSSALPA